MFECHSKVCKDRDPLAENVIIYLKWHDASYQDGGPYYISEIKPVVILESVGILIKETDTHYSFCTDRYTEKETYRHITNVPKGMVVEVRKFEIDVATGG